MKMTRSILYQHIAKVHGFELNQRRQNQLRLILPDVAIHSETGKIKGSYLPHIIKQLVERIRGTDDAGELLIEFQKHELATAIEQGRLEDHLELGNVYNALVLTREKVAIEQRRNKQLLALNDRDSRLGNDPNENRAIAVRCLTEALEFDAAHVYTVDPESETWMHRYVVGETADLLFAKPSVPAERTIKDFITRFIQGMISVEAMGRYTEMGLIELGKGENKEWSFITVKDAAKFKLALQDREHANVEGKEALYLIFGREEDIYYNVYMVHNWHTDEPIFPKGENKLGIVESFAKSLSPARKLEFAAKERERLIITDQLTNLYNRRHFIEELEREISRAKRYEHPISLVILDIDHFKAVNDTYGHLIGDAALAAVAKKLRINGIIRDVDVVARYGGEEFALILPETNRNGAFVVAKRLREKIELGQEGGEFVLRDGSKEVRIRITVSVGVATSNGKGAFDSKELIGKADTALYEAKRSGRNRVVVA